MSRDRIAERLCEVELSTKRFIDVVDGWKKSHDHAQVEPDSPRLSGNYGIYAGPGADGTADVWLVDVDVDDYNSDAETAAIDGLPETLTVETPHTDGETGGHRFYAVTGDVVASMKEATDTGAGGVANPSPSWGEIRVANQYVVGPGSQIDEEGCDKDWCDKCAKPDGGHYRIARDVPIATITADELADVVRADPAYADDSDGNDGDLGDYEGNGTEADAVARENRWIADYLALGADDRSTKDHAVCRAMIEHGVGEADARSLLESSSRTKVSERGGEYWRSTWSSARKKATAPRATADGGTATTSNSEHLLNGANDHHRTEGGGSTTAETWDGLPIYNSRGNIDTRETRRAVADILLENNEFATPRPDGVQVDKTPLHRYWSEEGFFERAGGAWVHRRVGQKAPYLETADIKEIVNRLRRASFVERGGFDAGNFDEALVNLGNGVYDLDAGELRDHSPEYLFRTSIPRSYDPDAECPHIDDFIESIVPGDRERQTLYEWIGYCLEVGYPIHRFLILYGGGRNGKGVYFRLIREFLSNDNVSGVTLDTIASGGFGVSELDDNLVNVDTESVDTRLRPSELNTLKALSGGDQRQVDVKYQEPYDLENAAKLAFSANNPPRFDEDTDAVADRLLAIEFPYRFGRDENADKEATPERELIESLTTEEELSGLLNRALEGLQRVRERGYFSIEESGTARDRFDEYMNKADSIVGFANHCLENRRDYAVPKPAVYAAYKHYCDEHEHSPAEEAAFFRQLGRKGDIETYSKRPRVVTEGSKSEYKTAALDHLWFTDEGVDYLSQSARDDVILIVAHMHASSVEKATEQLHEESINALTDRILRTLREMDGDRDGYAPRGALFAKAGVAPSRGNKAIKRLRDRGDIAVDGTNYQPL